MATLKFPTEEVHKLIEHTKAAPQHRKAFGEEEAQPCLIFVHDDGLYLMSNGLPALLADGTLKVEGDDGKPGMANYVVYAKGYNPKMDADVWEKARGAVGGDDFAEHLPITMFEHALVDEQAFVTMKVTAKRIAVETKPRANIDKARQALETSMADKWVFADNPKSKSFLTMPKTPEARKAIQTRYPKAVLFNDLPLPEAVATYLKMSG